MTGRQLTGLLSIEVDVAEVELGEPLQWLHGWALFERYLEADANYQDRIERAGEPKTLKVRARET